MRILVCIKQVPDTTNLKVDPVTGTLIRTGVPSIVNPEDMSALEAALVLRDQAGEGSTVTVLTMGPKQAEIALRECLAMGADDAVLLCDRAFAGSDTWATSNVLVGAIEKLGLPDVIFAGREAIDGNTAQVGPQVAQKLDLPQISCVTGLDYQGGKLAVVHEIDDGQEKLTVPMPVLLTVSRKMNEPRTPSVGSVVDAFEKEIPMLTIQDIELDPALCGLKASPTRVVKSFATVKNTNCILIRGTAAEAVNELTEKLREQKIVLGDNV